MRARSEPGERTSRVNWLLKLLLLKQLLPIALSYQNCSPPSENARRQTFNAKPQVFVGLTSSRMCPGSPGLFEPGGDVDWTGVVYR